MNKVKIWEESYIIPTYKVHSPEKNPLFIEKRAYQGSTGKVYPLPVTEKISDVKEDYKYKAIFLENDYLKVMILPELGGRIQRAYDKTNGYDFVYYNHVIKPALVGLTGPWISGGIEFNWPQHHRPSTYSPVDYKISENADGSCTVYLSEIDKMYGTKGMAKISLYPEKAYIEIQGQLYNNTNMPQTFLWWANPAVPVNDYTYSVFPPDVNAVMDHGKRAVSTFPIATGEYYKMDYSAGVDISRYKNVKVPTSYMAAHSDFNFIGNYDESLEAGLVHVADHHISPGKKQWTWGNGDFGRTWDKNLTDEDGPYIELMTGVYTDNQPDFTWLKPHEEKSFVQYFMPYKGVGRISNATKDAMINISKDDENNNVTLKVYATGIYPNAEIKVIKNNNVLYETVESLSPEKCFITTFVMDTDLTDCEVIVSCEGKELVKYAVYKPEIKPIPQPAEYMKKPEEMKSLEELYLAGTHLEQYRHATFEPSDYYLEGLRRDSSDIRLNNAYGLLLFRRGHIKESIKYFKSAIDKQIWKNPNPYYGECYFNLGLAYEADEQYDKAYDAFFKSTWSAETQNTAFYWLACLAARKNEFEQALEFVDKSLIRNWHDMKARTLKLALLRKLGKDIDTVLNESINIDPLYMGILYEEAVKNNDMASWKDKMRKFAHNYLELSLIYLKAGLYQDAYNILINCEDDNPLVYYYLGYISHKLNNLEQTKIYYEKAEQMSCDYCFPNRLEEITILKDAIQYLNIAPLAHYYLGNLLYDKKQYTEATNHWEEAVKNKEDLAVAYRNLAISYYNKEHNNEKALNAMKKACELDSKYPRLWLEFDQLAAKVGISNKQRLEIMQSHLDITKQRDDLYLRYITLLNCVGEYEKALNALQSHRFHPWEGGEGKVITQYKYALIHLAIMNIKNNNPKKAVELLLSTLTYPDNLGEGKLPNVNDHQAYYYLGIAYQMMDEKDEAEKYWTLATKGSTTPSSVLYYNDQPSDYIFYQGLANEKLGHKEAALKSYHQLITYGERHLFDKVEYDFFAVSLPEIEVFQDDIELRNLQYCNYLRALGHIGVDEKDKAKELLDDILNKQYDYQGAIEHLNFC